MVEVAIVIIPIIVQVITVLSGLYFFNRRFPIEAKAAQADANVDNASASKQLAETSGVWLENYNRMFKMMQERDIEIATLQKTVLELKNQQGVHEMELEKERKQRIEAQEARAKSEREKEDLQQQVKELKLTVEKLEREVTDLLKQPNQTITHTETT
jgi:predicted  nucleic acid-binding Zn-ribbon protein